MIVTRGVHYNPMDPYGPYHFNIQIQSRGYINPTTYHVYVTPILIDTPNRGINIDAQSTVTLACPQYWTFTFARLTS